MKTSSRPAPALASTSNQTKQLPSSQSKQPSKSPENTLNIQDFVVIKHGAVLKKGAQGEVVKQLQQRLSKVGFGIQTTSLFGSTTEETLKRFQTANHIQPTGQLGPTTLKALEKVEYRLRQQRGQKLANQARIIAQTRGTVGQCYNAVYQAITPIFGDFLQGGSAYQAAKQLAKHPSFKELKVTASQLPKLPAGSIVVWGQTYSSPHGHISISLGNGQEASDHIAPQLTDLRGYRNFRVFEPL